MTKNTILFALVTSAALVISTANAYYVGVFGGGGAGTSTSLNQVGTAFLRSGALAVNANGNSGSYSSGLLGVHLGMNGAVYRYFTPAVELEGFYLRATPDGQLTNPTPRIPGHAFSDSFPMKTGVYLANVILNFPTANKKLFPYLGLGAGFATINISGANSSQITPAEANVNHFNSNTNSSSNTFSAQAKMGLNLYLAKNLRLFGEYRRLYLSSTSYTFGSTQYPTHAVTTNWNAHIGNMNYNLGVIGIDYVF